MGAQKVSTVCNFLPTLCEDFSNAFLQHFQQLEKPLYQRFALIANAFNADSQRVQRVQTPLKSSSGELTLEAKINSYGKEYAFNYKQVFFILRLRR